jgi:hypothetical protein
MAGPAPKTRDWRAIENAHKPKGLHVLVSGQVQVGATNMEPRLTETPERNPKNLGLNLTIESHGAGDDVMVWKAAYFHKEVTADQYDHVVVRWDVKQIANIPVLNDRELAEHADATMKVLNQQHAGKAKPAKPAGKKPAAKKAASKKKAPAKKKPAAVGGWAKGKKAKKAKKTKKAPKKAAKRSTKKRPAKKARKKR